MLLICTNDVYDMVSLASWNRLKNVEPPPILVFKQNESKIASKYNVSCLDQTPSTGFLCSFCYKNICPIGISVSFHFVELNSHTTLIGQQSCFVFCCFFFVRFNNTFEIIPEIASTVCLARLPCVKSLPYLV